MESRAFIGRDGEEVTEGQAGLVPWWSFTKTVLAIALLRLAEVGRIDLDACVDGKVYTPAQLLRHEAGLPDYGPLAAYHADVDAKREPWSEEKLRAAVQADVPLYPPGRGWSYSNVGYLEVARLIERSSNQPLSDALNHWVFSKAGLNTARLASGPEDLRDVLMGDVEGYHPGWVYHGLVVGTAVEAARLLRALFRGELLAATSFSRMIEAVSLPQHRTSRGPGSRLRYGFDAVGIQAVASAGWA
jgi:CubicO group peptidase (beta-lactamase class C family)